MCFDCLSTVQVGFFSPSLLMFPLWIIFNNLKAWHPLGATIVWALAFLTCLNICLEIHFYILLFFIHPLIKAIWIQSPSVHFRFYLLWDISLVPCCISPKSFSTFEAAVQNKIIRHLLLWDAEVIFHPYLWHLGSHLLHVHWIRWCCCWMLIV